MKNRHLLRYCGVTEVFVDGGDLNCELEMTQVFQVLHCCECKVFQVHQIKKSNKWNCKVCGIKQSIRQVYGKGSGFECRKHVQKLNSLQGQQTLDQAVTFSQIPSQNPENIQLNTLNEPVSTSKSSNSSTKGSKWSKFLHADIKENKSVINFDSDDLPTFTHSSLETESKCPPDVKDTNFSYLAASHYQSMKIQDCAFPALLQTSEKRIRSTTASDHEMNKVKCTKKQKVSSSDRHKKSKWALYGESSDSKQKDEDNCCEKNNLNDLSDIQNVQHIKPSETYKGFQFILKASLKSGTTSVPSSTLENFLL